MCVRVLQLAERGGGLLVAVEALSSPASVHAVVGSFVSACLLPRMERAYASHARRTNALLKAVAPGGNRGSLGGALLYMF